MNDPAEPATDIAIIGIGCLFPKADSPLRFWRNIQEGVDCISRPPESWANGSPHGRMDEASDQKDN